MRKQLKLNNGITVSVINEGYGREKGLFEVAARETKYPDRWLTGKIWKEKAGSDEVIGWLTEKEVIEFINRAKKMKIKVKTGKK